MIAIVNVVFYKPVIFIRNQNMLKTLLILLLPKNKNHSSYVVYSQICTMFFLFMPFYLEKKYLDHYYKPMKRQMKRCHYQF